jgi:hypothetical protein
MLNPRSDGAWDFPGSSRIRRFFIACRQTNDDVDYVFDGRRNSAHRAANDAVSVLIPVS